MRYTVTIAIDSEHRADVVLKDVESSLRSYWKHTHDNWIKNYAITETPGAELDLSSSASRQHYIDTGRYLTVAEVAEQTARDGL